jgi:hypothetical protein
MNKTVKLSMLFLLVFLLAGSSQAFAAKKGTISADRCSGSVALAKISGYTPSNVNSGYIIRGKKVYQGELFQTAADGGTIYRFSELPKKLAGARVVFSTNKKTYLTTLKVALKRGSGKLC